MSVSEAAIAPSSSARVVTLVTAAVFINYVDRGNLATVAPLMQDQLGLRTDQLGLLLSAFYFSYVPCMPVTGWLADRFGAKRILALGLAVWALSTLSTGFVAGFASLLCLRLVLGIGESATFPSVSKILADVVDPQHRGLANGIMSFGYLLGPAIGTFLGGELAAVVGWRWVFIAFGALSLLWLLPWRGVVLGPPRHVAADTVSQAPPLTREILANRSLWGASIGQFASNYVYYFVISWLPFYLVKVRGFSIEDMSRVASIAYLLNAVSAMGMGWLTDRWIRAGVSPTLIYKTVMGLAHVVGMGCMIGMLVLPESGCVASLYVFCLVAGCSYPGIFAIPQTIAGPAAAGRWVGVQNAVANVAGMVAPVLTGYLVDRTGLFDVAFTIAAAVNVLGFVGWVVLVPRVAPYAWRTTAGAARGAAS